MTNTSHYPGKTAWSAMLAYTDALHRQSTRAAEAPFPHSWEEIGPGYCYGPAFGHWDIVHQVMDRMPSDPQHAKLQIANNLHNMTADGFLPGAIWMQRQGANADQAAYAWSDAATHPPVWPVAADALHQLTSDNHFLATALDALLSQIDWWEHHRKTDDGGYFYTDITDKTWESGVDEGIRFDDVPTGRWACVDATSHVFMMYDHAARWATHLGRDATTYTQHVDRLTTFVRDELWCDATGFFHDIWAIREPTYRCLALEGMWPVVAGIATTEQAMRVIDENLLSPDRFFTAHPLATVARCDPRFQQRMWRGPAWNSMTWWAAQGCARYQRNDAARRLLESALDASAHQFTQTGTIWEFYHSDGGDPTAVARKPHTDFNTPCRDYLGHNPLLAMARLWQACSRAALSTHVPSR